MKTQAMLIHEAAKIVGSQAELARRTGMAPAFINQMIHGKRPLPAEWCIEIDRATDGRVPCEQLRPDMDWSYIRGTEKVEA